MKRPMGLRQRFNVITFFVAVAVLLSLPLLLRKAFVFLPSAYVTWAGALLAVVSYLGWIASYTRLTRACVAAIGVLGGLLIFFSDAVYDWGRFTFQRSALEAYVDGGPCPAERCMREAGADSQDRGLVAIVWGEDGPAWTGVCYDASNRLAAAAEADRVAREAGKERLAHHFASRIHRIRPLDDGWSRCSGAVVVPKAGA